MQEEVSARLSPRIIVALQIRSFAPFSNSVNLAEYEHILAFYPHSLNTATVYGSKRKTVYIRCIYVKPYTSWTHAPVSTCRKQRRIGPKYGTK